MIDLEWIRGHPKDLDRALGLRGASPCAHAICTLDCAVRENQTTLQRLQAERNALAHQIGLAKKTGADITSYSSRSQELKHIIPQHEQIVDQLTEELQALLALVPNIPDMSVPCGKDENDNVEVRRWGVPRSFDFDPKPHEQVKAAASWMNNDQAVAMSGSRLAILQGPLARLERALAQFMLDLHTDVFGYGEVSPPYLVRDHALFHTGQLPKMHDDLFQTTDQRWLIPTSEVPLTNMVANQILTDTQLPLRYVAYTPCFRKEAGAAGRDTQGLIRLHQFSKVELVSITAPDQSDQEHERMTAAAEEVLKRLELPYRVIVLCTGDMGFHAQKTYDLEVWFPHQDRYREISSCSNCGDFQARRMKARYRTACEVSHKPILVHTLNGSGVAVGRALAAVIENYQQADGSVVVPRVLQPYMKGMTLIHEHS